MQIDRVHARADDVGSPVVLDGSYRPTRWDGASPPPADLSWQDFPGLAERYAKYGSAGLWWWWFERHR